MTFKKRLLIRFRDFLLKYYPTPRKLLIHLGIFVGLVLLILLAVHINRKLLIRNNPEKIAEECPQPVRYEFEIPVDSFDRETFRVAPNQFLSNILADRGISMQMIDRIAREYRDVFDVRQIKSGNRIHFFYSPDTLQQVQYMVYEKNVVEYVVYDFRDSLSVILGKKEVVMEVCYLEGEIQSSIWEAIASQGLPTGLVNEITEVYAWMINPFALNRGDRFEVIYENELVDSVSVGVGKVLAARFMYGSRLYEAYAFEQNGNSGYYDAQGESLKRAFLKAPLSYRRISSRFSGSRMHPVLMIRRPHYGVDYAAPTGTPVVSIGDGRVIMKGWDRGGGNVVKIKHNAIFTSGYMHLSKFGAGIHVGANVTQGQVIGYVGSTGLSTGPHLDFRIWKNGHPVDPLKVESPPVEPVTEEFRPAYDSVVRFYQKEFERFKAGGQKISEIFQSAADSAGTPAGESY